MRDPLAGEVGLSGHFLMGWKLDGGWPTSGVEGGVCSLLPGGEGSSFLEGRFPLLLEDTVSVYLIKA